MIKASAVRIHAYGGPEEQIYETVEVGEPGPGEVGVRQTAIGVNYTDIYHRRGEIIPKGGLPFINGFEGAGVVESVGQGVTDITLGQRVAYQLAVGAYATHRLVPAGRIITLPDSITDMQAAGMMLKGATAEFLVRRLYSVKPDDVVLVHAAAGGVGLFLCQWAKHLGATVIGIVGSDVKATLALAHGCDHVVVINGRNDDFIASIRAITGEKGVSVIYNGVAGSTFSPSLDLLCPRGVAVVLGTVGGKAERIDVHALKAKSLSIVSPSIAHFIGDRQQLVESMKALFDVVTSGAVRVVVNHTYALREIVQAHVDIEARRTSGSVILLP